MTANRPFDDEDLPPRAYDRRADPNRADREISLGTPTILGIFFVLTLAFAAVFGLGYTMGHRSGQNAQASIAVDSAGLAVTSAAKPNAGSGAHPVATPVSQEVNQTPASAEAPAPQTATVSLNPPPAAKNAVSPADAAIAGEKIPPAAPQPTTSNQQPATSYVVQVAAVSSQDVADILLSSLQKKGYTVAVHHEPQDKLLHVQIGPFPDKKQAEAMRQRVLADGFNAMVK
jgi:DedD protein